MEYEIILTKEVLQEIGADVFAKYCRYAIQHQIEDSAHPIKIMARLVWEAKQSIFQAITMADLEQIQGRFDMAEAFLDAFKEE